MHLKPAVVSGTIHSKAMVIVVSVATNKHRKVNRMSAYTTVYVKVTKEVEQWIEVQAVTCIEAKQIARDDLEVVRVLEAQYDKPDDFD